MSKTRSQLLSQNLEDKFPKHTRLDFAQTRLLVYTNRGAGEQSNVVLFPMDYGGTMRYDHVFVPMAMYLRAIDALDAAEAAIRILGADDLASSAAKSETFTYQDFAAMAEAKVKVASASANPASQDGAEGETADSLELRKARVTLSRARRKAARNINDLAPLLNRAINQARELGLTVDARLTTNDILSRGGEVAYQMTTISALVSEPLADNPLDQSRDFDSEQELTEYVEGLSKAKLPFADTLSFYRQKLQELYTANPAAKATDGETES